MFELGVVHGRIELDQNVAGLDALPVTHVDRSHDTSLERLDHLGAAARNDLALGGRDDVDASERGPGQSAAKNSAMTVAPIARPIGDGGVSTIFKRRRQEGELVVAAANLSLAERGRSS